MEILQIISCLEFLTVQGMVNIVRTLSLCHYQKKQLFDFKLYFKNNLLNFASNMAIVNDLHQ